MELDQVDGRAVRLERPAEMGGGPVIRFHVEKDQAVSIG
jgi:hypothetical protein